MPKTTTEKGLATRKRMIRTASELFRRQGYDGTGMSEIVERSGAPRGSLYFHFPGGKRELAAEAVRASAIAIGRAIETTLESTDDVAEAVARVVELIAADLERTGFRGGCPIAAVTLDGASRDEPIASACRESFEHWQGLLEARLRRAGHTPRSARDQAMLLLAAIEGAQTLARARADAEPMLAIARRCRAGLIRAA